MIHLYSHGYSEEDLLDFEIKLSNPSSIAQQQKLELIRSKFDIASAVPEGLVDKEWIRKNIMEFNDDEIARIERGKIKDKLADLKLEAVSLPNAADANGEEGGEEAGGGGDMFGGGDMGMGGGAEPPAEGGGEEAGGGGLADLFAGDVKLGGVLAEDDDADESNVEGDNEDEHLLFDEDLNEDESNIKYEKIKPKASQQYRNKKLKHGAGSVLGADTSLTNDKSWKYDSSADLLNTTDKSRGALSDTFIDISDTGMDRKSVNPLRNGHERVGDPQMKKIFDSMNRNFGGKLTNNKNRPSKLLNEDTEMIIIDNEDYGDE